MTQWRRTRAKPFVAWMRDPEAHCGWLTERESEAEGFSCPVVVTPLLPDDPKPEETWMNVGSGRRVVVEGPPYEDPGMVGKWTVRTNEGPHAIIRLRRPPVMKTFRFRVHDGCPTQVEIIAESRDAALAKLAESLEEVS